MPEINIPLAIGIAYIVGLLTHEQHKVEEKELAAAIGQALIVPFVVLGIGWIVTLFL